MKEQASQIVVLAGSGRSGTTWLGSILDSYERAEYFYEICHYLDLSFDFDSTALLRIKYPLTFWLPSRSIWLIQAENKILQGMVRLNLWPQMAKRALWIGKDYKFVKHMPDIRVFKIVRLLLFSTKLQDMRGSFGSRLKIIHILRNPFATAVSEMKNHAGDSDEMERFFRSRIEFVINDIGLSQYHELAKRYLRGSCVEHIALLWRISNERMLAEQDPSTTLVLYEDLCRNAENEVRRLFGFLEWLQSEQTEKHIGRTSGVEVSQSGKWSIMKNSEESRCHWKRHISVGDYERIAEVIDGSPLLKYWRAEELSRHAASMA